MGETGLHVDLIIDLRVTLKHYLTGTPDVYVGANMFLYYVKGDPRKCVCPDIYVAFGVSKEEWRTYKVWEEGGPPDLIIEISSRKTWREDRYEKLKIYEAISVKEYFIFDPEHEWMTEPVLGWRLRDGSYELIELRDNRVASEVLGLDLVNSDGKLRLFNPKDGRFLPTPDEESEALRQATATLQVELENRRQAETARHQAETAQRQAETAQRQAETAQHQAETAQHQAETSQREIEAEAARLRKEIERLSREIDKK
jgi:Uma2 family endonuclease